MDTLLADLDALVRGEVSSAELTARALARAHAEQPRWNAFVSIDDDAATAAALEADRHRAAGGSGDLLGVPIVVKDDLDVAGRVTGRGSRAFTRPAPTDSPMATALTGAGAVVIGRTALPELAACGFTESVAHGATHNPHDLARTPGGSSGGTAAAVAAGVVTVGTASDGAGSIRIPAACCGLPGFKPSAGTMPSPAADGGEGWHGLSTQGCLTRTIPDAACFLDAVGTFPTSLAAAAAADPPPLRIGVDVAPFPMAPPLALDPAVGGAVRRVADLLADLGHHVRPVRIRPGAAALAALASNARFLRSLADSAAAADEPVRLERRTAQMARIGSLVPAALLGPSRRQGTRWGTRVLVDAGVDVLLTPTMRGPAPVIGRWAGSGGLATLLSMARFYAHTPAWNHTGQPAVSLPAGSAAGLPLAVQLVASRGEDARLVALAASVERALTSRS